MLSSSQPPAKAPTTHAAPVVRLKFASAEARSSPAAYARSTSGDTMCERPPNAPCNGADASSTGKPGTPAAISAAAAANTSATSAGRR